ncbi:mobilization protein [Sphingomonas crocodyli]|uniref:Mobilization protein n=1 Tax=Sphingomonas crocodyli TaxID=1979270 RepID=A0A437LYB1_9SPHN|nr:mobilization protein [Sphingomonas crocodyli]RVT90323.1 mobilization protein [Sphingomonas crocodyli]
MKVMTSFTFLVPDKDAARFDRLAEGQGGRSALLRRLVLDAVGEGAVAAPLAVSRSLRADQRLEILLTSDEVAAVEAMAARRGMKRSGWLVSLVRRRLHCSPEPAAPDGKALEAIRSELRRIGVSVSHIAEAIQAGEKLPTDVHTSLDALRCEIRSAVNAVGAARRGDLAYWDTPE